MKVPFSKRPINQVLFSVLELSRSDIGTLKFSIEDVDIPTTTEKVKEGMTELVKKSGLKLEVKLAHDLPKIKTDKEKLEQILINLISNSIKYSEKGVIKLGAIKEGNYVKFSVADNGIGIPKGHFKDMFKRFYQVESHLTRKVGGINQK